MGAAKLLPSDPTYYYARVVLTVEAWKDLDWWERALNEPDFSARGSTQCPRYPRCYVGGWQ
eukprot:scaffold63542_cov24-Attheya_sp.AAC.1